MAKSMRAGRVVVLIVLGIQPAAAQTVEPAGAGSDTSIRMAEEIAVMELALANAVNRGAQTVEQQFSGAFPGLVLFAGHTQVRGFRLADFGAFFDVEYPVLRQHIFLSMQMLEPDVRVRLRILEGVVREPEQRVPPGDRSTIGFSAPDVSEPQQAGGASGAAVTASEGRSEHLLVSPHALYEQAVEERLVEAVLQHGSALATMLAGDDWLHVTARDVRGLRGRDTTLRLWWDDAVPSRDCAFRIRAADLIALHQGHLTLEEARARISVEPF